MDKQNAREIRRIWGRTKAAKQLLDLDMSQGELLALKGKYKKAGLIGPFWHQGRHQWVVEKFYAMETGMNHTALYVNFLDTVLDINEIAEQFKDRTPSNLG